ncbi:MAG: CHASE3 domain-containing protein [Chitinophagaceae bacterium]|jgi:hypothetical protein
MRLKDIFTSAIFLKSIFALSLFILVIISAISYKHNSSLTRAKEDLIHSYSVRNELELLHSYMKDAETGQRGFIISNDSSFLAPYLGARKNVNRSFFILKKLAVNNKKQQINLDTLYDLVNLKFLYLAKTLNAVSETKTIDSATTLNLLQGKMVMDRIRGRINTMIEIEKIDLKNKQERMESAISFTPLFTFLLLIFSLFVFIASYIKINNNIMVLEDSNAQLMLSTASIRHAEKIGNFSTWHWDLTTNEITFSENQKALLGVETNAPLKIAQFLSFVHPDDKHLIEEGTKKVLMHKLTSSSFFRIIRKDGKIRYFKSIGKIVTDQSGKKILIGINTDITEQHLESLSLEERNKELEQSNKELASFNYVASHDLQEPLRIIQTYISRIEEKEIDTLTSTGQDYFERIKSSANRMQILINDLLLFSRTNKFEKVVEATSLNELLENALIELSPTIEDKNATIEHDELPELKVVPFQMQQLFINLLNNSLKYSKKGVAPVIKIKCELVFAQDVPELKADPLKQFFKITFTDNGLGFEQQYADNIFVLFKRLHHKNEYPGTGIGLSICKKIAENHSGFIRALGIPDEGATFTLYLPYLS